MGSSPGINRPASAPELPGSFSNGTLNGSVRPAASVAASSPVVPVARSVIAASTSKSKGMQLGAHKMPGSVPSMASIDWAEEAAAEADGSQGNPWGNDDLMDVNADQDDWSECLISEDIG